MPPLQRIKTQYPGVYYILGANKANGQQEKIYYIRYCRDGRQIDEKVGRQFQDDITPARANAIRADRILGKDLPNQVKRQNDRERENRWTMDRLWSEYVEQRGKSGGVKSDDQRYRKHLSPAIGAKEPHELHTLDVTRIAKSLAGKIQPQTIKHVLGLIKRLLLFGVRQGLINMPDTKQLYISLPRADNKKTEDLTPVELARLWQVLEEEPNRQVASIMKVALLTGMRRGEVLRLRWDDLDFERGFITIRPENAKNGAGSKIPMSAATRKVLEGHPKTHEFVFPGKGPEGHRSSIQVASNKIKQRAGLPKDFRPMHGLRHVFASMLASSGKVDMYTIQKLLTHKSPMMTQRYAHLRDDSLRRASELAGSTVVEVVTANVEPSKTILRVA